MKSLEYEIDELRQRIDSLKSTSDFTSPKVDGSPTESSVERVVLTLLECCDDFTEQAKRLKHEMGDVKAKVKLLSGAEYVVVNAYYLEGKSVSAIGRELGYSREWVKKKNGAALETLRSLIGER